MATSFDDNQAQSHEVSSPRKESFAIVPYWFKAPMVSTKTIWLEREDVVEYCPNAETYLLLNSAKRITFVLLCCFMLMMLLNSFFNFLTPTYLLLGKTFLLPLKSFIFMDSHSGGQVVVQCVSFVAQIFFLILGMGFAFLTFNSGFKPTHIGMTRNALCIVRRLMEDNFHELIYISCKEIREVRIFRPRGKRSVKDYELDIVNLQGETVVTIRYGDVYLPEDRARFLSWLEDNVENFDSEMLNVLRPKSDRQSYTELWLQELSAPPKRDKLTPLSPGASVNHGKYRVVSKLGVGGQGTVYLACSTGGTNTSEVVLKEFVLPIYPDPRVRRQAAEKFQEEAELLSRLDHPRIVDFLELFIEDHRAYLVLEKVEGRTLEELVEAEGKQPEKYVISLAMKMCEILDYLHSMEPPIVHRDFTPDNLILEPDGNLKLIDFSVAQRLESNVTGSVVGKPNFIAPEQFRGRPSEQSDIYSMAATLYFLLTGQRPEPISRLIPSRTEESVSNEFDKIIARATHLDCRKRYHSIKEMQDELARISGLDSAIH
ncbi:MAG: serine/threonine protein kinase [Cyanobacteria bacterium]|nr:serine/threonine protein kinase [Cyanobacteriota bacterium]